MPNNSHEIPANVDIFENCVQYFEPVVCSLTSAGLKQTMTDMCYHQLWR